MNAGQPCLHPIHNSFSFLSNSCGTELLLVLFSQGFFRFCLISQRVDQQRYVIRNHVLAAYFIALPARMWILAHLKQKHLKQKVTK